MLPPDAQDRPHAVCMGPFFACTCSVNLRDAYVPNLNIGETRNACRTLGLAVPYTSEGETTPWPAAPAPQPILPKGTKMTDESRPTLSGEMGRFAMIVAMTVRNAMEDFHCEHLTDEQMRQLNPIIRNAIGRSLRRSSRTTSRPSLPGNSWTSAPLHPGVLG